MFFLCFFYIAGKFGKCFFFTICQILYSTYIHTYMCILDKFSTILYIFKTKYSLKKIVCIYIKKFLWFFCFCRLGKTTSDLLRKWSHLSCVWNPGLPLPLLMTRWPPPSLIARPPLSIIYQATSHKTRFFTLLQVAFSLLIAFSVFRRLCHWNKACYFISRDTA